MTEVAEDPSPSYVIGLIEGGRAVEILLLNCRLGTVYGEGTMESWNPGKEQPVEEYFETLKEKYRRMQILPKNKNEVSEERKEAENFYKPLKEIFKKHGWPDAYNKDECVKEIADFGTPNNWLRLAGYGHDSD